jgi:hypothetical protein
MILSDEDRLNSMEEVAGTQWYKGAVSKAPSLAPIAGATVSSSIVHCHI